MVNDKIIQRAVAKSIVWDTSDIIKLIAKYEPINKNASYAVLLSKTQKLLATNQAFAKEFTALLVKNKRLTDYNSTKNADGEEAGTFFSGFMTGGLSSLSGLTSTIIGSVSARAEREHEEDMLAAQQTTQIMNMMMQEDQAKQNKANQDNMMIIVAVVAMIAITGLIIYKK